MKNILLVGCLLFCFTSVYSQSTEITLNLNSGLFSFAGESASSTSWINLVSQEGGYTNNPYGSQGALSYGLSASLTQVYRSNFLAGFDLGYELLRSEVEISSVVASSNVNTSLFADGQTYLRSSFINLFPRIGYRLSLAETSIDISGGIDIAYCISAQEKGSAEAGTREYFTERSRKTINTDIRPRVQANVSKGKYGVYAGYSSGIRNYRSGFDGGTNEAYSRMVRFGLTFRLH